MNVQDLINAVTEASANRQYQLLGALAILVIVMGLRKVASFSKGKLATFVNSDMGGVTLSVLTSAAGATYSALKGGAALNMNLVVSTLTNAALASGVFTYGKHARRAAKAMRKPKTEAPPASPPPVASLFPLVLCVLTLSACAHVKGVLIDFGKCELGQVPSALAGVLSDVDKTLGGDSPNWQSDMETLGKKEGMEAVNCAVAAVLHNLAAKKSALDEVGKRKSERGQIWLAGHKVAQ